MSSLNDKGIVVKITPLNENDKIIALLTQNNGRINAVAKGINKIRSRKAGSLDLFNHVSFRFFQGKSQLDLLTEVKLISDFRGLKTNFDLINLNMYAIELIDKSILGSEKSTALYDLLLNFLSAQKESTILETIEYVTIFQIKLLDILGYSPLLDECIVCGEELTAGESRIPSIDGQMGYVCHRHIDNKHDQNFVEDVIIKIQRFIIDRGFNSAQRLKVTPNQFKSLFTIQHNWLQSIIEKKINTTDIIRRQVLKSLAS